MRELVTDLSDVRYHYPDLYAFINKALLQFCGRTGFKDSRGRGFKGLLLRGFMKAFSIFSITAIFFFTGKLFFPMRIELPVNNIRFSTHKPNV